MPFDASQFDLSRYAAKDVITLVLGLAALVLILQSAMQVFATHKAQRIVNRRLKFQDRADSTEELIVTLRRQRALDEKGEFSLVSRRLNELITRSGVTFKPVQWMAMSAGAAIALGTGIWMRLDNPLIAVVAAGLAFAFLPLLVLKMKAKKRRKTLARQLPDALQIVVRSLEAGHPVATAIALVGRELPDPIGTEFGMAADEIAYGFSLTKAIERMAKRVGDPDIDLFAATVRLQEKTGGNLCDLLKTNAATVRDRQTLRLKVKAASAEGRASALILTAAPFVVMAMIHLMKPDFYGLVAGEKLFRQGLIVLGGWMLIGNVIMNKMINFKF